MSAGPAAESVPVDAANVTEITPAAEGAQEVVLEAAAAAPEVPVAELALVEAELPAEVQAAPEVAATEGDAAMTGAGPLGEGADLGGPAADTWSPWLDSVELSSNSGFVTVPRSLLKEVLIDGSCPLHLRWQLLKALQRPEVEVVEDPDQAMQVCHEPHIPIATVESPCLAHVASHLALGDTLALRATSSQSLEWAMQRSTSSRGELQKVHDRIRTRLWVQRAADLTKETTDETIFETQVRSFANDALRRRMEAEMAETKAHMERQIHAFQGEVDRRMEEQALRVHAIVEERVQQQLDSILAAEMERVRAMVEDRVQERVRQVVQREVCATVCEVQARLAALARENDRLRAAFVEHTEACCRSLAMAPDAKGLAAQSLRALWSCRKRLSMFSAWLFGIPPERKREQLRIRLAAVGREDGLRSGQAEEQRPRRSMELGDAQSADRGDVLRRLLLAAAQASEQRAAAESPEALAEVPPPRALALAEGAAEPQDPAESAAAPAVGAGDAGATDGDSAGPSTASADAAGGHTAGDTDGQGSEASDSGCPPRLDEPPSDFEMEEEDKDEASDSALAPSDNAEDEVGEAAPGPEPCPKQGTGDDGAEYQDVLEETTFEDADENAKCSHAGFEEIFEDAEDGFSEEPCLEGRLSDKKPSGHQSRE